MSHREEVELIRRRAFDCLYMARVALETERFDIAVFLAEQAAQLFLKAIILERTGEMPRTHRIRELLGILRAIFPEKSSLIENFVRENRQYLSSLEDAYTASRYLFREYEPDEANDFINFARQVIDFGENLRSNCRDEETHT